VNSNLLAVDVTGGKTRDEAAVESPKRNKADVVERLLLTGLILAVNKDFLVTSELVVVEH
jgi:hypothetical protein